MDGYLKFVERHKEGEQGAQICLIRKMFGQLAKIMDKKYVVGLQILRTFVSIKLSNRLRHLKKEL